MQVLTDLCYGLRSRKMDSIQWPPLQLNLPPFLNQSMVLLLLPHSTLPCSHHALLHSPLPECVFYYCHEVAYAGGTCDPNGIVVAARNGALWACSTYCFACPPATLLQGVGSEIWMGGEMAYSTTILSSRGQLGLPHSYNSAAFSMLSTLNLASTVHLNHSCVLLRNTWLQCSLTVLPFSD